MGTLTQDEKDAILWKNLENLRACDHHRVTTFGEKSMAPQRDDLLHAHRAASVGENHVFLGV